MKTIGDTKIEDQRIVVFPALTSVVPGSAKQINFLLSVNQVEDVVKRVDVRPVPFSPPWVEGISRWRNHIVPVVSLEGCLGLKTPRSQKAERLLMVKSVTANGEGRTEKWGLVKTGASIRMMGIPGTRPVTRMSWIPKTHLVKGIYEWESAYLVVVDLNRILNGEI